MFYKSYTSEEYFIDIKYYKEYKLAVANTSKK
jgi:hypothetical protein